MKKRKTIAVKVKMLLIFMVLPGLFSEDVYAQYKTGTVLDSINKQENTSKGFTLYLPIDYNHSEPYGLAVFFDPAGRGKHPVKIYQSLANEFNLIFIGLNDSKNGLPLEANFNAFLEAWKWLAPRFNIQLNNIHLIGFSGGARTASYVTQRVNVNFAGVVGIGAGVYSIDIPPHAFRYIGIVGNEDINYYEVTGLVNQLIMARWEASVFEFGGGHEWCPKEILKRAFVSIKLGQIKNFLLEYDSVFVDVNYQQALNRLEGLKTDWVRFTNLNQIIKQFDGFKKMNYLIEERNKLRNSYSILSRLEEKDKCREYFNESLKDFASQFQTMELEKSHKNLLSNNRKWWERKLESIPNFGKPDLSYETKLMKRRIRNYLNMVLSEGGKTARNKKEYKLALAYFDAWTLVPGSSYKPNLKLAEVYAEMKDKKNSLKHLKMAIEGGFSNKKALMDKECFKIFSGDEGFSKILASIPVK